MKLKEFKDFLIALPSVVTFYTKYKGMIGETWYAKITRVGDRFKKTSFRPDKMYVSTTEQTFPAHTLGTILTLKDLQFVDDYEWDIEASKIIEALNVDTFVVQLQDDTRIDCCVLPPSSHDRSGWAIEKLEGQNLQRVIDALQV